MKGKKNLILLIGLIVLAGLILIIEKPLENKSRQKTAEDALLFPDINPSAIRQIKISKEHHEIIAITSGEDTWTLIFENQAYPASPQMVNVALETFLTIRGSDLASRNRDKHDLLQVADHNALRVTLLSGSDEELGGLLIGKSGPDFFSTYIRKAGADDVYLSDAPLTSIYDRPAEMWRDTTLFRFDPVDATELVLLKAQEQIALGKDTQGNWHLQKPISGLAQAETVEKILTGLSDLKASDYADGISLEESGVQEPAVHITITFKDNTVRELLVGNRQQEEGDYYITTGDRKYLYTLHPGVVEHLVPPVKDLEKTGGEEVGDKG